MDGPSRASSTSTPTLCRRLQASLAVLVVAYYLLYLIHGVLHDVSYGCDTEVVQHCWGDTCFVKCCADHQAIASSDAFNCSNNETDTFFDSAQFVRKVKSKFKLFIRPLDHSRNVSSEYFVVYDWCNNKSMFTVSYNYAIVHNDTSVVVEDRMYIFRSITRCVDFVSGTDLMVLEGCSKNSFSLRLDFVLFILCASCMIASTIAISFMLAVYLYLPQLQGFHRNILLCYLVVVMTSHPVELLSAYFNNLAFNNFTVFLSLCSATWLAIMSYDIWSTFSHPFRHRSNTFTGGSNKQAFLVYSLIGWGCPIAHILLKLYVKCLTTSLVFNATVVAVLLNLVMFLSTIINLRMFQSVHFETPKSRSSVLLYLRLFLLMGADRTIFAMTQWFSRNVTVIMATLVLVQCQGTFLFVLLLCNRRVLRLLCNKWRGQQSGTS